jgi:5'(3')-deoxyribonucleotidase
MKNKLIIETNGELYCDLDGVLADFEKGVHNKLNKYPEELNENMMWNVIRKSKTFYENLPWMPEGKALWERIKKYNPIILTGCPYNYPSAVEQKQRWCARELGPNIKVITCKTREKPNYCKRGDILIDDREIIMKEWIEKGGKYIHYKEGKLEAIMDEVERGLL